MMDWTQLQEAARRGAFVQWQPSGRIEQLYFGGKVWARQIDLSGDHVIRQKKGRTEVWCTELEPAEQDRLRAEMRALLESKVQGLSIGQVLMGKVLGFTFAGALIQLENGLRCLLPTGKIRYEVIAHASAVLTVGQELPVKVKQIMLRPEHPSPRIVLSHRSLLPNAAELKAAFKRSLPARPPRPQTCPSFELASPELAQALKEQMERRS